MNTFVIVLISVIGGAAVASMIFQIILRKKEKLSTDLTIQNRALMSEKELLEKQIVANRDEASKRLAEAKEEAAAGIRESEARAEKQLREQMEALKLAFGEAANKIFEEKSKNLSESNEKGIKTILDPLKEKMEEFKKEVMDTKEKSIKTNASLQEQIRTMMDKATSIGAEANNLAAALKGGNKIQGNWGETHLEKLLQDAGFVEGVDYESQSTVRDASGNVVRNEETNSKLVPDITLTFPDKRFVIIDSKVSLTAYMDYCREGITEEEKEEAKKRHIESIRTHIKELSRKDYASGLKRGDKESFKYVIMYIPNEGAFQLFFSGNQAEWRDTFDKNQVMVIGDLYLITMLKIIRMNWDASIREKNTEKIMQTSTELLDRVSAFISEFEKIGDGISKMGNSFESAKAKLYGRISIASTSRKLKELGVETKKPIAPNAMLIKDNE